MASCHHHLLLDGWSMGLVLAEVFDRYGGRRPPGEPRPYRSYVEWLRGRGPGEAEAYWRRALAGVDGPTPLGLPRAPEGTGPRRLHVELSEGETEGLRRLARERRVTLSTVVAPARQANITNVQKA